MALTLVSGASLFFLSMNSSGAGKGSETLFREHSTTISGLVLMACYLLLDAFTPNYQKKLLDAKVSTWQVGITCGGEYGFFCVNMIPFR
jgi:hypothetical protein